jgi:hypothetical protein
MTPWPEGGSRHSTLKALELLLGTLNLTSKVPVCADGKDLDPRK